MARTVTFCLSCTRMPIDPGSRTHSCVILLYLEGSKRGDQDDRLRCARFQCRLRCANLDLGVDIIGSALQTARDAAGEGTAKISDAKKGPMLSCSSLGPSNSNTQMYYRNDTRA